MSRSRPIAADATLAVNRRVVPTLSSHPLLPPAIKGIVVGFAVGLAAILGLTLFAPSLVHADTLPGPTVTGQR
jgi:hypothetical protein